MNPRAAKADIKLNCKPERRKINEDWADLADDLRRLADQAYLEFQVEAGERLAIDQYLRQLETPQITFSVKQKRPERLDDAVAATLGMETYVLGVPDGGVTVSAAEDSEVLVAAIFETDKMANVMEKLVQRVESLESKLNQQSSTHYGSAEKDQSVTAQRRQYKPFWPTQRGPMNQSIIKGHAESVCTQAT